MSSKIFPMKNSWSQSVTVKLWNYNQKCIVIYKKNVCNDLCLRKAISVAAIFYMYHYCIYLCILKTLPLKGRTNQILNFMLNILTDIFIKRFLSAPIGRWGYRLWSDTKLYIFAPRLMVLHAVLFNLIMISLTIGSPRWFFCYKIQPFSLMVVGECRADIGILILISGKTNS